MTMPNFESKAREILKELIPLCPDQYEVDQITAALESAYAQGKRDMGPWLSHRDDCPMHCPRGLTVRRCNCGLDKAKGIEQCS